MKNKVFFHIDMNAFFANVERLKNPQLKKTPIVIARNHKRAVVITCTYDLRKLGVRVGKPIYRVKEICPPNTVFVDPNYFSYSKYSIKIFNFIYHNFSTKMEINSIDECYLDVSDIWKKYGSVENLAKKIIEDIKKHLRLPCSIGISFSKFYAKLANNLASKENFFIISPKNYQNLHWKKPISSFHNVGVAMTKVLNDMGIKTALEYVLNYPKYQNNLLKHKNYLHLYLNLKGEGSRELQYNHNYVKSLGREHTFEKRSSSLFQIRSTLIELVLDNVRRGQKINVVAKSFVLKVWYDDQNYANTHSFTLKNYTMDEKVIRLKYEQKLQSVFKNKKVKLIGCYFKNIVSKYDVSKQLSIFEIPYNNTKDLIFIADVINHNFRKEVVFTLEKWSKNKEFSYQNRFIDNNK